jgi:hypothetical protein
MVDTEVVLTAGYALFLLGTALGLDLLARHSSRRSERYRTAGFTYHAQLDLWVCPEGEHLWPKEHDPVHRLVRYRARPHVCNRCPSKGSCTESDEGREIVRFLDPWPQSDAGRFHRGLSLTLVVLGGLLSVGELVRHHRPLELLLLLCLIAAAVVIGVRLAASLRGGVSSLRWRSSKRMRPGPPWRPRPQ